MAAHEDVQVENCEFPKIRGTYNKDPTISGTIFGSPIFENSQLTRSLSRSSRSLLFLLRVPSTLQARADRRPYPNPAEPTS